MAVVLSYEDYVQRTQSIPFEVANSSARARPFAGRRPARLDRYFGENSQLAYLSKLAQAARFFDAVAEVQVSRYADVDKAVSLALDAGAALIVSGDGDLKDVKVFQGIEIISPSVFLDRFTPPR